jgi:hypothetical protein
MGLQLIQKLILIQTLMLTLTLILTLTSNPHRLTPNPKVDDLFFSTRQPLYYISSLTK